MGTLRQGTQAGSRMPTAAAAPGSAARLHPRSVYGTSSGGDGSRQRQVNQQHLNLQLN